MLLKGDKKLLYRYTYIENQKVMKTKIEMNYNRLNTIFKKLPIYVPQKSYLPQLI